VYIYNERQNIPDYTHGLCKHYNLSTENDYESVVYLLTYVCTAVKFWWAKICMYTLDGILVIELWVDGNQIQHYYLNHCLYMLPTSQQSVFLQTVLVMWTPQLSVGLCYQREYVLFECLGENVWLCSVVIPKMFLKIRFSCTWHTHYVSYSLHMIVQIWQKVLP
jgi:hypothetical protein